MYIKTESPAKDMFREGTTGGLAKVAPSGEIHLEQQCASEGIMKGVDSKGEFHEIAQSASEALLAGVTPTREIHLEQQCASEGILKGGSSKGEFHDPTTT